MKTVRNFIELYKLLMINGINRFNMWNYLSSEDSVGEFELIKMFQPEDLEYMEALNEEQTLFKVNDNMYLIKGNVDILLLNPVKEM